MKAWVKKGEMYFDDEAWTLIKKQARRQHRSPKLIVIRALRRGVAINKLREGK